MLPVFWYYCVGAGANNIHNDKKKEYHESVGLFSVRGGICIFIEGCRSLHI